MSQKTSKTPTKKAMVKCLCHACAEHSGFVDAAKTAFCGLCQGAGTVRRPASETFSCAECDGTGKVDRPVPKTKSTPAGHVSDPCSFCAGTGRTGNPAAPYHNVPLAVDHETQLARIEARLAKVESVLFT